MNVQSRRATRTRFGVFGQQAPVASGRAAWRARIYTYLAAFDIVSIVAGFFAASLAYPAADQQNWLMFATVMSPIYAAFGVTCGAYSHQVITRPNFGILRAVQALALASGTLLLFAFYLKSSESLSRFVFALGSFLTLTSIVVIRHFLLRHAKASVDGNPFCIALIVDGEAYFDPRDYSTVIFAGTDLDPEQDCPEMFDRLAIALRAADRVVVHCPPERRTNWVQMLKGANVRSEIIAPELGLVAPLALGDNRGTPTLVVADGPLSKADAVLKRVVDILLSGFALLLLAPALLAIALLIKLGSPGPVLFVQTRIGLGNRLFAMYKFRSMRVDDGDKAGHRSTGRDDDRITPIGRLIRRTSIDELPQLFNVLIGDMSIVGPRPHALGSRAENKLFWEVDSRYWHRHAAKPGLTGLAQVRGFRGATERTSDLTDRLQADLEYLHDWTIWRDMLIIIQTVRVLVHRNAY